MSFLYTAIILVAVMGGCVIATVIDVMAGGSGITNPLQPENPLQQIADVNHDGTVDVADIAAIIDQMAANARRQREMQER